MVKPSAFPRLEVTRARFAYDPLSGLLTYRTSSPGHRAGDRAGCLQSNGYRRVKIDGRSHYEHRVAWLLHYGAMPPEYIDHINGDKADNSIANLRTVAHRGNMQNFEVHRRGKRPGYHWDKLHGKWRAAIQVKGKVRYLGLYDSSDDAHAAYLSALARLAPAELP